MVSNEFWPRARTFKFIDEVGLPRVRSLVKSSEFYFLSAMYSPFCLRTCTGSLPVDSYMQFKRMEVYIMQTMAKAFQIVRDGGENEYADDLLCIEEHIHRQAHHRLHMEVSTFDVDEGAPLEAVSVYTEDLLLQADLLLAGSFEDKTIAYTVAKVASVLRLYHSIGRQFMKWILGNERYRLWFQYYGSDMFKALVEQIEHLLDKSCSNFSLVQLQLLDNCYKIGLSNLLSCFSDQSVQAVVPILAPAFQRNDVYLVCQLACVISFKEGFSPSRDSGLVVELGPEYKKLEETFVSLKSFNFDMKAVEEAFQKLSGLRDCLYREVEASHHLVNIDLGHMLRTSLDNVLVNSDFIYLINKLHHQKEVGCPVHLYSLDFSSDFIGNIFQKERNNGLMDYSANKMFWDYSGISTGQVSRILKYPSDLVSCHLALKRFNICVGSAVDDLLCLLRAEIGIVVEPARNLIKVANNFVVRFVPLLDLLLNKQLDYDAGLPVVWKHEAVLYLAKDWCDVAAFVCCLHNI